MYVKMISGKIWKEYKGREAILYATHLSINSLKKKKKVARKSQVLCRCWRYCVSRDRYSSCLPRACGLMTQNEQLHQPQLFNLMVPCKDDCIVKARQTPCSNIPAREHVIAWVAILRYEPCFLDAPRLCLKVCIV